MANVVHDQDEKVVHAGRVMMVMAVALVLMIIIGMMAVMFRMDIGTARDDRKRTPEQTHLDQQGEKNQQGCAHVVGDG